MPCTTSDANGRVLRPTLLKFGLNNERAQAWDRLHETLLDKVRQHMASRVPAHTPLLHDPFDARDARSRRVDPGFDSIPDDLHNLHPDRPIRLGIKHDHECEGSLPGPALPNRERPRHAQAGLGMPIPNPGHTDERGGAVNLARCAPPRSLERPRGDRTRRHLGAAKEAT